MTTNVKEPGLDISRFQGVLKTRSQDIGWSLCIGAGTSLGALPDWATLVKRLLAREGSLRRKGRSFARLRKSLTTEALIQAARNRLSLKDEEFANILSNALYDRFRRKVGKADWELCAGALSAISPGQLDQTAKWDHFLGIIRSKFPDLSALHIADTTYTAVKKDRIKSSHRIAPAAILTFNAEPLLYALINAHAATHSSWTASLAERRLMDRVNLGISYRVVGRIPYIFCHGLLPIPKGSEKFERSLSAEKLVFSESEYLSLANSSFSWASSMFLSTAVLRTTVFVGLSFTDQNLRRWLAWVQDNKLAEIEQRVSAKGPSEQRTIYGHYWINKRPATKEEEAWIESSVEHLGVRLVWMRYCQMLCIGEGASLVEMID
jgi:SIR2-like domain